jgi:LPXTG-motif cell wall-anchored protein
VKCDPCPPDIPRDADINAFGADVIGGPMAQGAFVLTRLHARYGKNDMKDDLRFKEAKPIVGGREMMNDKGVLEMKPIEGTDNFFQGRYAIRYPWTGAIRCKNPTRNVWGPNPNGVPMQLIAAKNTSYAPRGKLQLASVIKRDIWEIGVRRPKPKLNTPTTTAPATGTGSGAGSGSATAPKATPPVKTQWFVGIGLLALLGLGGTTVVRRRRKRHDRAL